MIQAVKTYFHFWIQLHYWIFFKPVLLRECIDKIAPGYVEKKRALRDFRSIYKNNKDFRLFIFKVFSVIVTNYILIWLLVSLTDPRFQLRSIILLCIIIPVFAIFSLGESITIGINVLILTIIGLGLLISNQGYTSFAILIAGLFIVTLLSASLRMTWCVTTTIAVGGFFGIIFAVGPGLISYAIDKQTAKLNYDVIRGLQLFPFYLLGSLRFPVYLIEVAQAISGYYQTRKSQLPEKVFERLPISKDDLIILPHPFLSRILLQISKSDIKTGISCILQTAINPFQNWASQRAIKSLCDKQGVSFFLILHYLLELSTDMTSPTMTAFNRKYKSKIDWEYEPYSNRIVKRILADLSFPRPMRGLEFHIAPLFRFNLDTAHLMTSWLKDSHSFQYSYIASSYYKFIDECEFITESFAAAYEPDKLASNIKQQISQKKGIESRNYYEGIRVNYIGMLHALTAELSDHRDKPHAEEFYNTFKLILSGLSCRTLQDIADCQYRLRKLVSSKNILRPNMIEVAHKLNDVCTDVISYLTAAHELTKRDAILQSQAVLEEANEITLNVYEPERSFLNGVIETWRRIIVKEGKEVSTKRKVTKINNPYIAGRPITPSDGKLFVGRRNEFLKIEELINQGMGIVIYGQRRIGKSSILRHLHQQLPHNLIPINLNLQLLKANSTGGMLHSFSTEIHQQLRKRLSIIIDIPSPHDFEKEPYLSFNRVMKSIDSSLSNSKRIILSMDEFEELEKSVNEGRLDKNIFDHFRGITQSDERFSLLFAGLHTLDQMTREYWNPFFGSVKTVQITYLTESDARQLITDPIENFPMSYENDATELILQVSNSHPFLLQDICHNIVNRMNHPRVKRNKVEVADVEAVLDETLQSGKYYYEDYIWKLSNDDEKLALSIIADFDNRTEFSTLEKYLGRESALKATETLKEREIIIEETNKIDNSLDQLVYDYQIPLSKMWVKRSKPLARILLEQNRM